MGMSRILSTGTQLLLNNRGIYEVTFPLSTSIEQFNRETIFTAYKPALLLIHTTYQILSSAI